MKRLCLADEGGQQKCDVGQKRGHDGECAARKAGQRRQWPSDRVYLNGFAKFVAPLPDVCRWAYCVGERKHSEPITSPSVYDTGRYRMLPRIAPAIGCAIGDENTVCPCGNQTGDSRCLGQFSCSVAASYGAIFCEFGF